MILTARKFITICRFTFSFAMRRAESALLRFNLKYIRKGHSILSHALY